MPSVTTRNADAVRIAAAFADLSTLDPDPGSLRERKKAKTRAALIDVSQRMFAERGYTCLLYTSPSPRD